VTTDSREKALNSRLKHKRKMGSFDFTLLFVIVLLLLFGIVMVFSASYYLTLTSAKFGNDPYYFVKRQLIWALAGVAGMTVLMNFPYKYLKRFTFPAYIATIICLVLVLIVGEEINGSKRWLGVGPIGFQPSEVAKIVIILYLSHFIASHKGILGTFKGFLKCCFILGIPVALIAVSNMSTALVVGCIGVAIMFVASPKIWYFVVGGGMAAGAIALMLFLPQFAYRLDRIKFWLDPFSDPTDGGFQIIQGLYAVASGGIFGLGLGQSRQKTYIPEPYNDMIFAIICEELGFVGAAIVILLFVILIWRGLKIAMEAEDMFGCLIATGISAFIGVQVVINISVATNSMPNTGMALPFISYGGSALVFTLAAMGILLNISRFGRNRE